MVNSKSSSISPEVAAFFARSSALAGRWFLDLVPGDEFLVAGKHEVALAAFLGIEPEAWLSRTLSGNADFAPLGEPSATPESFKALLYRLANLRARAAQETLAIGQGSSLSDSASGQ